MAINDLNSERLFVTCALSRGAELTLSAEQSHYLVNVLRLKPGADILVFNGKDGEWRARIKECHKRAAKLEAIEATRAQHHGPDIQYLFAPLKHARLDYMVQKAVEMGVARLSPVLTRRTVPERVKLERMRANAIEAAEQCGVLRIPEIDQPVELMRKLDAWPAARPLIFCDEAAPVRDPIAALRGLAPGPASVLVGPEGGFDPSERKALFALPFVVPISLGPRIMRADTAAVAVLSLVNATLGDWRFPI